MNGTDPSRIDCAQPNCTAWIGGGTTSASIPKSERRALLEEIAEVSGWRQAGSGWFCPPCVKRGKATEHNPDYLGRGTDRLGRRLQDVAETQGIAARSDETRSGSAEGKSPVGNADAPETLSQDHPHD